MNDMSHLEELVAAAERTLDEMADELGIPRELLRPKVTSAEAFEAVPSSGYTLSALHAPWYS